jgi:isoleucyl-tRNA synthetase
MFEAIPAEPNFSELERAVDARWATARVFERSMTEREGAPSFVFYEGPPTANGRPGVHHVWARVYKDLFCRYQTMQGRQVRRRAGWDTHGLAVEVEVERRLGLSGKDQIEAYGVEAFIAACRESVVSYVEEWERLTRRIGYFTDTDDAYWTLDPRYIQSVWWHLRQLYDAGLLFSDLKVVPYCPRCGTALSSHELGQPEVYAEVEDRSAYVRLSLEPSSELGDAELVVWTTTPWTLLSNVAVAVHKDLSYVVVDGLVVAEQRAEAVLGEGALDRVQRRLLGADLVGLRYRRPVDVVELPEGAQGWRVVAGEFVTADEGTGLVHIAPAFGADDWALGRAERLTTLNPVGADGRFSDAAGLFAHMAVREANDEVVALLESTGRLLRDEWYRHAYPHCWRCGTALIYWGTPSWYVATASRRDELLAANETVTWRPESAKHGRFGEWLANNVDWALSRDRYWGTPLPIWQCPQRHTRCVASLAELSELAGRDVTGIDPHRPAIDEVSYACPDCGETAYRVPAVIDAWFDSGAMPAAQWGYPAAEGSAENFQFPADFIVEAVDQTRGWFYSLLAVNVLVFNAAPYRTVGCLGHIVDATGRKMSKHIGNVIDPFDVLDRCGADPVRWWMFHQGSPWTATRTSVEAIDASTAGMIMTLWHTWSFFTTYASLNDFDPAAPDIPTVAQRSVLDRWMASRVACTIETVTEALDNYYPLQAADAIALLVEDCSNWYVRRSRRRFWRTDVGADPADIIGAEATLHHVLCTLALLLAPFCPFLAEQMWCQLTGAAPQESVHLAMWPRPDEDHRNLELEKQMALARRLASLGRSARAASGVKVRQPLHRAVVVLPPGSPAVLGELVADELNVDEVVVAGAMGEVLSFELVANFRRLGPRLGEVVKAVPAALRRLDAAEAIARLDTGAALEVELDGVLVELSAEEIEVRVRPREGFAVSREGSEAVALDLEIDDDLARRGMFRDVVRQVQELRRSSGLAVSDRITLVLEGLEELEDRRQELAAEVLATAVHFRAGTDGTGEGAAILTDDGRRARAWITRS